MKRLDTDIAYLANLLHIPLLILTLCLGACTQQEEKPIAVQADIQFQAHETGISTIADGYALRFQEDGIYLQTPDDMDEWTFQIGGADAASIQIDQWSEKELWYKNIYPKIHLRFFDEGKGNAGYHFHVKTGGEPSQICLALEGKQKPYVSEAGELILPTTKGELRHSKPIAYQTIAGKQQFLACQFTLENNCLGFEVSNYDKAHDLVIE